MAKEQCPACDDYQGERDFDPDIGFFYVCAACGHRWSYQDENRRGDELHIRVETPGLKR